MSKRVSYDKQLRDKAKDDGRGLMTLAVIAPGTAGKFGCGITMQGPIDKAEYRKIWRFMLRIADARNKKMGGE